MFHLFPLLFSFFFVSSSFSFPRPKSLCCGSRAYSVPWNHDTTTTARIIIVDVAPHHYTTARMVHVQPLRFDQIWRNSRRRTHSFSILFPFFFHSFFSSFSLSPSLFSFLCFSPEGIVKRIPFMLLPVCPKLAHFYQPQCLRVCVLPAEGVGGRGWCAPGPSQISQSCRL